MRVDSSETPEYAYGAAWAEENRARVAELYSSKELATPELRTRLFEVAGRMFPSKRDSMENDLKQTCFVMGAMSTLSRTLPLGRQALAAIFDAALELGSMYGAEAAKEEHLELLKKRDKGWWRTKHGDASPNDIVNCLAANWWRDVGFPEERRTTTKWEVLIYTCGSREMSALATLLSIEFVRDREYFYFRVRGEEGSFDVMAEDAVHPGGIVSQRRGDIVG